MNKKLIEVMLKSKPCPACGSTNTTWDIEFGKYRCKTCTQLFD